MVSARTQALAARVVQGAGTAVLVAVPFVLLLFLVRGNWAPLRALDLTANDHLTDYVRAHPPLLFALRAVAVGFAPKVFYVVEATLVAWLWWRGLRRLAVWVVVTALTGALLGAALKLLVERARPLVDDPVASAGGFSFPSGHALNSFVGCAILLLVFLPALRGWRRRAAWAAAVAVVAVTGFDRVALGVHYVSDVVAGWAVAAATVAGTTAGFEVWRREHRLPASSVAEGVQPEAARALTVGDRERDRS